MANILGSRKRRGGYVVSCKSESEWDGVPKGAHWCGLQFAVRYSWDLWIQIRQDVREFYSRYCLSLTPSVCVITASAAAVSSHTHAHADTHACTPPPVLPKGTWCWGVPLPKSDRCSNRKSKNQRPIIPIICSDMELMSGFLEVTDIWSSLIIQRNSIQLGSFFVLRVLFLLLLLSGFFRQLFPNGSNSFPNTSG